jgi:hypothetical protein
MKFSPQLLPNNPAGITPDWEALLTQFLTTWPLIRLMEVVECGEDGSALGRSLKPIPSEHIKAMTKTFRCYYNTKDTLKLNCTAPT